MTFFILYCNLFEKNIFLWYINYKEFDMLSLLLKSYKFLGNYAWLNEVYTVLPPILYAILGCVGGAGTVYAIILGVNLAKADSDDTRKNAANRLKNTIIGVAILLVLVLVINLLLPMALAAFLPVEVIK